MARDKQTIINSMLTSKASNAVLNAWNSTSATAIYLLFIEVAAEAIFILENLFDFHKADIEEIISRMKPHSLRWYAEKSKAFQLGFSLVADADYYNNTGVLQSAIDASKIIAYVGVVEQDRGLRIKVAKANTVDLEPLVTAELLAFKAYMSRVKDAGVKLNITSTVADELLLQLKVKYNPIVLNGIGARLDGTVAEPVKDAIKLHLKNLPFNGVFSVQKLVDTLQAVEGVADLSIDIVQTKYGALPFVNVNIDAIPDSGYLRIQDANLTINYISA